MCLHRMADRLYGSLQRECDAHIGRQLAGLAAAQTADPTIFLQQVSLQLCRGDLCASSRLVPSPVKGPV